MAYPSTISTLANPAPTDRLNSPSHSGLHDDENTAITEIQTFVGTTSSAVGTLVYDIRSSSSDGGGHVQTAVKGGTGQTTYTKGNLLVAQNSSTLTKLTVGLDGQALVANSSVATGITWGTVGGTKIANNASIITIPGSNTTETSVMTTTIPASVLTGGGALVGRVFFNQITVGNSGVELTGVLGSSSIFQITLTNPASANVQSVRGVLELTVIGSSNPRSVLGMMKFIGARNQFGLQSTSVQGALSFQDSRMIYEDTGSSKLFGATARFQGSNVANQLDTGGSTIEKIV